MNKMIGVDLGTATTLVYVKDLGLQVNQSSAVAYINEDGVRVGYLYGNKAKEMFGKTPIRIEVIRPMMDGVVSDLQMTQEMISNFLANFMNSGDFFRSKVVSGIPLNATSVEKYAIYDVFQKCGASEVFLVYESMACAIGANLPINEPKAIMIIDIGGGTTEISIISLGGVVVGESIRLGGTKMDNDILEYVKKEYNLIIGIITAEEIKIKLSTACFRDDFDFSLEKTMKVRGRDSKTGAPKEILLKQSDIMKAIDFSLSQIILKIKDILEIAPPELASDVVDRGIVLCGGGANIQNIDHRISQSVSLPVFIPFQPELCTARGIGTIVNNYEKYKHVLFQ